MARNTHDRQTDHHNRDLDTNIEIDGPVGVHSDGTVLHVVLTDADDRQVTVERAVAPKTDLDIVGVNCIIGNGAGVIPTGVVYDLTFEYPAVIRQWTLLADQSGSLVLDLWKDSYANYPPTGADSITASAKPTLASATKNKDATLTGWATSISAGDVIRINVDSATTVTRATFGLKLQRLFAQAVFMLRIGPNTTLFSPAMGLRVQPGLIASATTVFAPSKIGRVVAPARIGPATTVFAPSIS